jgi:hypothetical protein
MKHPLSSSYAGRLQVGNRRGVALVSVLAVLILLTVLVVAFLMRAQVARTSSANYRATTGTRLLADTVVNLVQAEINDATTYGTSNQNSGGTAPYTWVSQPGAIRVYDSSQNGAGATLDLQKIYRLYSAPALTTSNISDLLDTTGNSTELTSSTNWAASPARWVDLNAPVSVTDPDTGLNFSVYPILDNRSPMTPTQCVQMPGFFVNQIGTSAFPTAATTQLNPPVMPVQWLYVLQNGLIVAPTGGTGGNATFTSPNAPTQSNPIVGRIAYWTDDDTCKININTAGGSVSVRNDAADQNPLMISDGGVFLAAGNPTYKTGNSWAPASWDVPRFLGSWDDCRLMSMDQPVQGEYQRYPGHPATTALYYTLQALRTSTNFSTGFSMPEVVIAYANGYDPYSISYTAGKSTNIQGNGVANWQNTSSLFGLLPRYNDNAGSQAGLANTTQTNPPNAITTVRRRLYTSLGELFYSTYATGATPPVRTQNGTLNGSATPTAPYFIRQQIETGKFFLTTHSRAPETTLFGTPRVGMWPIPDTNATPTLGTKMAITTFDKLIAFCSTTDTGTGGGNYTYYLKRYDSASATNDYNNESRNQSLYSYLQALTSSNIPGYSGGSFATKYGTSYVPTISSERDQILTEIFDYIRSTNQNDHSWNSTTNPLPASTTTFATKGEIIPLQITKGSSTTQGLGRLLTLSEIGLQIICTADGSNNLASLNPSPNANGFSATISGSSVYYATPVISGTISSTIPVSPVIGSANDPAYVSNLPTQQYLRDASNNIVDIYGNKLTTAASAANTPFPANQTLTASSNNPTTGNYGSALAALNPGQRQLQAMLIIEPSSPMLGFDLISQQGGNGPDVNILVDNIQKISIAGVNPFPSQKVSSLSYGPNVNGNGYLNGNGLTGLSSGGGGTGWVNNGDTDIGGNFGFRFPMEVTASSSTFGAISRSSRCSGWSGVSGLYPRASVGTTTSYDTLGAYNNGTAVGASSSSQWLNSAAPSTSAGTPSAPYRFISNPFTITTSSSFQVGGAGVFNVALTLPETVSGVTTQVPYQTYAVSFPTVTLTSPPTLVTTGFAARYSSGNNNTYTTHAPDWWGFDNRVGWCNNGILYALAQGGNIPYATLGFGCVIRGDTLPPSSWSVTAGGTNNWSWSNTSNALVTLTSTNTTYGDVVRSVIPKDADYRLTMARASKSDYSATVNATPATSSSDFTTPALYYTTSVLNTNMFTEPSSANGTAGADTGGTLLNNLSTYSLIEAPVYKAKVPSVLSSAGAGYSNSPATPDPKLSYDWDNGFSVTPNGAYASKPDEGSTYVGNGIPYVNIANQAAITSYFTANRIVNSPVMFGSLPTGVAEGIPWRTLLFRPQMTVAQGGIRPNVASPAGPEDELLLDNFWMPVVQPYAISEPFSTAGKVNMNYQILPFTYITRSTALQAVLGSELIAREPLSGCTAYTFSTNPYSQGGGSSQASTGGTQSGAYSSFYNAAARPVLPARLPLNLSDSNGTLHQFRLKFTNGDVFRSAAEICDIYLVPNDPLTGRYTDWYSSTSTDNKNADSAKPDSWYGPDFGLVGDNVREHAYGDIYPRLTTKSNTYTVYYKVQTLKNPPAADQTQWNESSGAVTGEYRGSTSIERYLDPNNNSIPDYTSSTANPAATPTAPGLDNYYQWRTVANTAFAP